MRELSTPPIRQYDSAESGRTEVAATGKTSPLSVTPCTAIAVASAANGANG